MRRVLATLTVVVLLSFGSTADAAFGPTVDIDGGPVLDIGDSHTWLAGEGEQYPGWDTISVPGLGSEWGYEFTDMWLAHRHRTVVFDLATNDADIPAEFRTNLRRLWHRIGKRRLLLVTSYRRDGHSTRRVNSAIRRFTRRHPQRSTHIEWARWVRSHPEIVRPDGVHFTDRGYARRTRMIEAAVARLGSR